jgi:hypothetical protein
MGSSKKRKERREAERAQRLAAPVDVLASEKIDHAPASPLLRLVRSADESLPSEPDATGFANAPVDSVHEKERPISDDGTQAGEHPLVAGLAGESAGRSLADAIPTSLVRRSFDASEINPIVNDPSVFKYVAVEGMESLDLTPIVADKRNVLLMGDHGGILCCWLADGTYEVHTNFLKAERDDSRYALYVSRAAYRWMFVNTDCVTLLTRIPGNNRAARIFATMAGWTKEFERENCWSSVSDGIVGMTFCALRYDDWVRKTPELMQSGRAFHDRVATEFERHGRCDEQHADEDCHDLHVGACVEMIYGGQLEKAVILYNRWASFAGYGIIRLVSKIPAVIDIGNALIQITGDTFKVVVVR